MIVAPRHASHPDCRAPLIQIDAPHGAPAAGSIPGPEGTAFEAQAQAAQLGREDRVVRSPLQANAQAANGVATALDAGNCCVDLQGAGEAARRCHNLSAFITLTNAPGFDLAFTTRDRDGVLGGHGPTRLGAHERG